MRLYERLAHDLEALIREGTLRAGSRAPSICQLCRERAASPASVVRAYELLEARGLMESRARSGFFVTGPRPAAADVVEVRGLERVDVSQLLFQILEGTRAPGLVPLVTAGALEALTLALQVVTAPHDIVAIESPSFYGCLQAIEEAGRRAVEIPTDPQTGLDLSALEQTLDRVPVKACWFMTTFHNPLGATVPDGAKERLVRLLATRGVPLIGDDVYSELYFGLERPRISKVWDAKGLVLDCGSFAKSRTGMAWLGGGRAVRHWVEEPQDHDLSWNQHPDPGGRRARSCERGL